MSTGGCIPVFLRFFRIFRAEIPSHFAFSISYSCEQFYRRICSNHEQMSKNLTFTNKHISKPKKQKTPHRKQMLLVRGFCLYDHSFRTQRTPSVILLLFLREFSLCRGWGSSSAAHPDQIGVFLRCQNAPGVFRHSGSYDPTHPPHGTPS